MAQVGMRPSECANEGEAPCSRGPVLRALVAFAGETGGAAPGGAAPGGAVVERAAERAACGSESCVLASGAFRAHAQRQGVTPAQIRAELERRFKAAGPRRGAALLSNYNIDQTLRRWMREFPTFYACPFAMMDFDLTHEDFDRVDLAAVRDGRATAELDGGRRGPHDRFACVLNTDVSSGPGKHWVAVYADLRAGAGASIEYFNSAGNPPPAPVVGWMERQRALLRAAGVEAAAVPVTSVAHQRGQTECGLYTLYYIRRRLEGTPFEFFMRNLVPDEAMTAFRSRCFREV